jgi:hypothetical protein
MSDYDCLMHRQKGIWAPASGCAMIRKVNLSNMSDQYTFLTASPTFLRSLRRQCVGLCYDKRSPFIMIMVCRQAVTRNMQ